MVKSKLFSNRFYKVFNYFDPYSQLGCNPHRLLVKVVDLARFKSVKAAAAEIIEGFYYIQFCNENFLTYVD